MSQSGRGATGEQHALLNIASRDERKRIAPKTERIQCRFFTSAGLNRTAKMSVEHGYFQTHKARTS
jgi:hypothetical protein